MPKTDNLIATVAILTYNGETYLRDILEIVMQQEIDGEFEVLIIDSGSTDSTLSIIASFPSVRLYQIPNEEFGHGRTRNLAAQLAGGEYIAYLTHDAVPLGRRWLFELLAPFALDPKIVAVMGKQAPRDSAFPLLKYEIAHAFAGFGPDFGTTIFYRDDLAFANDPGGRSAITFYSDVNSVTRRSFLVDMIPYRDVRYAEDQMFGQDLIAAGYHKAYAPRATVEHSNDLTFHEYGLRVFDEIVGLREIGVPVRSLSRFGAFARAVKGALRDTMTLALDPAYGWRRLYWFFINPFYHLRKWSSLYRAAKVDLADLDRLRAGSLEHWRKKR